MSLITAACGKQTMKVCYKVEEEKDSIFPNEGRVFALKFGDSAHENFKSVEK